MNAVSAVAAQAPNGLVSARRDLARHEEHEVRQIRVAVVGCGYWGMNYLRLFGELPQSTVLMACDRDPERRREVARRFPALATTADLEDVLARAEVEAVVVCTEASSHHRIVSACLQAGKHVLVEKPITTTSAQAEDLIDLADGRGLTLMVGHTFLYNPGVSKIKELLLRQEIGRIYYLYASRTNLGPIRHDVNALWDLAPHDISIFNYLIGSEPEWVSAVGARVLRNGHEDVGFISLGYPDGVIGHIHVSWADPNKVREVVVVGSDKRIAFNDLNPLEPVRIFEKSVSPLEDEASSYGEYRFRVRDGDIVSPRVDVSEPLKTQAGHFLDCIASGERPLSDARAGRAVVRVLEAIDRSLELRGAPVEIGPGRSAV